MTVEREMNSVVVTPLSSLLVPFFNALDDERLPYCVCGNYEQLPEFTTHDVDIWAENAEKAEGLLYNTARQQGFKVHLINKTDEGSNIFLHKDIDDRTMELIRIDLMQRCAWLSIFPLVSGDSIKMDRRKYRMFYIPDPPVEASMQLLYPLISNGKVKDKYKYLILTWLHHPTFISILNRAIGRKNAKYLVEQIEAEDWDAVVKNVYRLRLSVISRSVFTNINLGGICTFLRALKWYIYRLIHHKGILIVLLGPDGCGKSTLCEKIPIVLQEAFMPGRVRQFYWRPMLLPPIGQLLSIFGIKSREEDLPAISQSTLRADNFIISTIRFIYYWLDFVIGRAKFYSVWARGGIVCFDRYYHDFFVYPQRFRLNIGLWAPRIFMPLVPKPDLIFYLHANPKELMLRKPEISLNELERQLNTYSSLLSSSANAYKIDVSQPLDEVVRNISSIILNFMTQREKKHYENK